jgi:hypothetical protein
MNYMLCRNRVRKFDQWKRVFDDHADAHRAAGLKLVHLWYELESPRNIFFLFEVENVERARAFLESPDATAAERESGLIEGDFRFFSDSLGYGPLAEAANRALAEATERTATNFSSAVPVTSSTPPEPVKTPAPLTSSIPPEPLKRSEPVTNSMPPGLSAEPEDTPTPSQPMKTAEPVRNPEPEKSSTPSEPEKSPMPAEPVKSPMPPATMKGPERVKSTPPPARVEGSEPVENWPPAEAEAQSQPLPAFNRRRWVRSKY